MTRTPKISLIKGDGIGIDVAEAALAVTTAALKHSGAVAPNIQEIKAGAGYYAETGMDIEPDGEERAGEADAIFLGAIGLPAIRHKDGTEISPHLRLRDRYQLYAGIRPVKAYPNAPQRLADPRAEGIDMIILRESTEGLFYTAAVHNRAEIVPNVEVRDIMRISRATTEKLHEFAFQLAEKRKERGKSGRLTCVDKANVFTSQAFFRQIFDEVKAAHPTVETSYNYVDAMALDLVRKPWEFDVMVMENMFGDILSDLCGGLVGGMGMAACGEIGDTIGLFQPAHGSAPDIMGQDKANPLAAILSGGLMLDYIGEKAGAGGYENAGALIDKAVDLGFERNALRPMEFGGDMGTKAVTQTVIELLEEVS
ncbi:isocitrate/isopropylmalate family dehydrogenase [Halocynthiibacter sp. C4]|uniref:isocitrate/isopropylmalate dehydrogenase family protein n=1 Tax=Halocynthiibacter sp. C4 TaxID=2992758 RepID=UPI00237C251F|nr:isocitrate/isopropylmalate family dehydrogenase [Halocynthiibacter sp. C4]MDE0588614.1 isocitrate/isopropylmalate family dehydrogenase [Halocynthiibacter sp. C4]